MANARILHDKAASELENEREQATGSRQDERDGHPNLRRRWNDRDAQKRDDKDRRITSDLAAYNGMLRNS